MEKIVTSSIKETKDFAKKIIAQLKNGGILGLVGELGAGKTVFVQGLAEALGIKEIVNSPTFVLMKEYQVTSNNQQDTNKLQISNIKQLIHIDAYRLDSFSQLQEIGAEEYFNKKDCLVAVEWADKVPAIKQYPNYQEINFQEGKKDKERVLTFF